MKKLLLAGLLAALAIVAVPNESFAGDRNPYSMHGMGWFHALAYKTKPGIFYEGPLYNYGPYNTQGLVVMHIPQAHHGSYTPADPTLWNRGYMPNPQYGVPGAYYAQPGVYGGAYPAGFPQR